MHRRDKLLELRQIVTSMQRQIQTLEQTNSNPKDTKKPAKHCSPDSRSSSGKRDLFGCQLQLRQQSPDQLNRWKLRQEVTKKSMEKYRNISQSIDTHYYTSMQRRQAHFENSQLSTFSRNIDRLFYQSTNQPTQKENLQNMTAREQNQNSSHQKAMQKRKRAKIFQGIHQNNHRDTDLNEVQSKENNQKGAHLDNILVQHPRGNPNLRFFGEKAVVCRGKGNISSRRNRSLIFGGATLVQTSKSCSKHHFSRYFSDHYSSCLS